MTKKDFELIAKTLGESIVNCELDLNQRQAIEVEFTNALATTNPLFSESRFLQAVDETFRLQNTRNGN